MKDLVHYVQLYSVGVMKALLSHPLSWIPFHSSARVTSVILWESILENMESENKHI